MHEILEKWIEERDEKESSVEKLNCIVVGKTGVGKSTLINAILGEKKAEIGQGVRGTQDLSMLLEESIPYTTESSPFAFFDTMGLELENHSSTFQGMIKKSSMEKVAVAIRKKIVIQREKRNAKHYVHCVFYCINAMSDRLEEAEIDLMKQITREGVKVFPVLTKVQDKQSIAILIQRFQNLAGFDPILTRAVDIYDAEGKSLLNPYDVSLMVAKILDNKSEIIYLANQNARIANWKEDKNSALKIFGKESKNIDSASFVYAIRLVNDLLGISSERDEIEMISKEFYQTFEKDRSITVDKNSPLEKKIKKELSGQVVQKIDDSRVKSAEKFGKAEFFKKQTAKGQAVNKSREKAAGTIAGKKLGEKINKGGVKEIVKGQAAEAIVDIGMYVVMNFIEKGADKVLEKQHFKTNFTNSGLEYLNELEKIQKEFYN